VSTWTLWTWISIGILIFGSTSVFVWFLFDITRIRREILAEERAAALHDRIDPDDIFRDGSTDG